MTSDPRIDALVGQWREQRPDIVGSEVMGVIAHLLQAAALVGRRIDSFAAERGLTRGEGDVLFSLRRAGSPYRLAPSRLAEALLVTSGTMTNRLDRLERRGLVRRVPDPDDRRGLGVELMPEAVALVDRAIEAHVANEIEMLAPLSQADRAALVRACAKLTMHLDPMR